MSLRFLVSTVLIASLGAACSGSTASGPSTPAAYNAHNTQMTAMGFRAVGQASSGPIERNQTMRHGVHLAIGDCYRFAAFGDSSSMDLEVAVVTPAGERAAVSETSGPQANTRFCAPATGEYSVAVSARSGSGTYTVGTWLDHSSAVASASEAPRGTCEAPFVLEFSHPAEGTNASARDNTSGTCLRGRGPDVIYSLAVPARRRVTITVRTEFDAALYLQHECGSVAAEVSCCNLAVATGVSRIDTVLNPGNYFIVVDSLDETTRGRFTLSAEMNEAPELAQVCAHLPLITPGTVHHGDTSGHPDLMRGSCSEGRFPGPDLGHTLTLTEPSRVRATVTDEGNWDSGLYIRQSCIADDSEIACNDDAEDTQHARITRSLPAGSYTLVVDGYVAGSQGAYDLDVATVPVAGNGIANETCANAQRIELDSATPGDTFAARDDLTGSCGGGDGAPDAVYRIQITRRTHFTAELARGGLGENGRSTRLYITRNCTPRGEIACGSGVVDAVLAPGTYYVVVDGATRDDFGRFVLRTAATDPAGMLSACQRTAALTPGTPSSGTTSGPDRLHASCGNRARSAEQVYSLRLTERRHVTVAVQAQYDSVVSLRSACARDSSEIACNDDANSQRASRVEADLDAGTYFVVVDGFDQGNSGQFTVQATLTDPGAVPLPAIARPPVPPTRIPPPAHRGTAPAG